MGIFTRVRCSNYQTSVFGKISITSIRKRVTIQGVTSNGKRRGARSRGATVLSVHTPRRNTFCCGPSRWKRVWNESSFRRFRDHRTFNDFNGADVPKNPSTRGWTWIHIARGSIHVHPPGPIFGRGSMDGRGRDPQEIHLGFIRVLKC